MTDQRNLKRFLHKAIEIRNGKYPEDVLRHNLSSWLPQIFCDHPSWINAHIYGIEEKTTFASLSGSNRGFVDSLVGKTVIEYEKDLRVESIYRHGKMQVCDYCAGELNKGSALEDIIGILSDTVWWYAYRIEIVEKPLAGQLYGREHIKLIEIEHVYLDENIDIAGICWPHFMNKYLGRMGARYLSANILARDFGIDSLYCKDILLNIQEIIHGAFAQKRQYAKMIQSLWVNFVSFVGGMKDRFSIESYANEFYIITLAKVLCANIISEKGLISSEEEIVRILNGSFYKEKGFLNFVEYDYFGWINDTPYVNELIKPVQNIQQMLLVYDYQSISPEDMFGRLVSQLSQREQRILLGQEETPQWLAKKIVKKALEKVDEVPHFIDMCCGSGVFLVEMLKQCEQRYQIGIYSSQEEFQKLVQSILGFDVDPLAVMLARANWMIFMRKYVPYVEQGSFIIPVFHADSFFAKTPMTDYIENDYQRQLHKLNFGGKTIILPSQLLLPQNRWLYTYMIEQCYHVAGNRAEQDEKIVGDILVEPIIECVLQEISASTSEDEVEELRSFAIELIAILESLQRKGLNGLWAYILGNTYRPALVRQQFNGIVSNPPWLALSKLKDNPYKEELTVRAENMNLKPAGAVMPHIELATIFMFQSIRHYLKSDAIFACIVPHSVLSGYQHEPFRKMQYEATQRKINVNIEEIWEVDEKTFKNRAIVLFGNNFENEQIHTEFTGQYVSVDKSQDKHFITLFQGKRSAWTSNLSAKELTEVLEPIHLQEGADIMYRTLIFYDTAIMPNGKWRVRSIDMENETLRYLVSDTHAHADFHVDISGIHDKCMYKCYLSKHLVPFHLDNPADAFLPIFCEMNEWRPFTVEEYTAMGFATSDLIKRILKEGSFETIDDYFQKKLNYRGKLSKQLFVEGSYLIVSSAGGAYPCSAYMKITRNLKEKMIIDQTLYWTMAEDEKEALYIVGMLNSKAIAESIEEFQPEGIQGRRHVHTIPFYIIPKYDAESEAHMEVADKTRKLMDNLKDEANYYTLLKPQCGDLQKRRNSIRNLIATMDAAKEYEAVCRNVLGI